ncbi:Phage chromosome segregation protein OS=Geomicrobium sp. JCM 19037 GN=JCM19037_1588 PE=4 SV=1: DUF2493 [Gemmataceae bacterium]|nr:Phage chromosome segregation protein OS=Geomicrobium sp. JCM 19037 GN=JCM19037_1588 PE=4 SV=1: DUF2493 [Gemmataceae bacterium]VTU00985.1 Phage chromosome segregation protein OS=Geomicrobium sp. JCM 19037 GN=JCM19037_1588 PE=4 SV=1: DUF2493 [Gemmataceae bacterium]
MPFRVLIIGGPARVDYPRLATALDALLAHRLPDVEILTAGGPGIPALAACYARRRGFTLTVAPLNWGRHREAAEEARATHLAALADAAVLVGDPTGCHRLLDVVSDRKLRVVQVGLREVNAKRDAGAEEWPEPALKVPPPAGVGLPD